MYLSGATNRPQELDEAARRRLTKRLYIPLPSAEARAWIVRNLLEKDGLFKLSTEDIDSICKLTEGYSGSDMKNLVKDASMGPLREVLTQGTEISKLKKEDMRAVTLQDFENALQEVRPSVSLNELGSYEDWNNQFGSLSPSTLPEPGDAFNRPPSEIRKMAGKWPEWGQKRWYRSSEAMVLAGETNWMLTSDLLYSFGVDTARSEITVMLSYSPSVS
ncbi:hypothetical protein OSB04_027029 [Centaurea solstitialis]|uniref:Uncharacterized protein n=1 Tax=Centaurea solstitialis TaxID=347529 RepID=A0AA38SDU0_9ASTR|nr:hypothetical protein OSB04_027029 [Centaurea solstitialis]